MSETRKHVLCPACGHMGCEHLAAELEDARSAARAALLHLMVRPHMRSPIAEENVKALLRAATATTKKETDHV